MSGFRGKQFEATLAVLNASVYRSRRKDESARACATQLSASASNRSLHGKGHPGAPTARPTDPARAQDPPALQLPTGRRGTSGPEADSVERGGAAAPEDRLHTAVGLHVDVAWSIHRADDREPAVGRRPVAIGQDEGGGLRSARPARQLGDAFEMHDAAAVLPEADRLIAVAVVAPEPAVAAGAELSDRRALSSAARRAGDEPRRLTGEVGRCGVPSRGPGGPVGPRPPGRTRRPPAPSRLC